MGHAISIWIGQGLYIKKWEHQLAMNFYEHLKLHVPVACVSLCFFFQSSRTSLQETKFINFNSSVNLISSPWCSEPRAGPCLTRPRHGDYLKAEDILGANGSVWTATYPVQNGRQSMDSTQTSSIYGTFASTLMCMQPGCISANSADKATYI